MSEKYLEARLQARIDKAENREQRAARTLEMGFARLLIGTGISIGECMRIAELLAQKPHDLVAKMAAISNPFVASTSTPVRNLREFLGEEKSRVEKTVERIDAIVGRIEKLCAPKPPTESDDSLSVDEHGRLVVRQGSDVFTMGANVSTGHGTIPRSP